MAKCSKKSKEILSHAGMIAKQDSQEEMQDEKAKPNQYLEKKKTKIPRRLKMRRTSLLSRWQEKRSRYTRG